jgi:large repetitive protein
MNVPKLSPEFSSGYFSFSKKNTNSFLLILLLFVSSVNNLFAQRTTPIPPCSDATITAVTIGGAASITACVGYNTNLSTSINPTSGTGTISYQWNLNGIPITSATSDNYDIPAITTPGTYIYTVTASNCANSITSAIKTITIVPDPISQTVVPSPNVSTVCVGTNVSATFSGGSGGTGTVSDNYQFSTDGGANWATYTPGNNILVTNAMVGTNTIQIRTKRTASGSACNAGAFVVNMWSVNALPMVTCPGNMAICINSAPFTLTGATPIGGTYSGTGVLGGVFNPSAATVGTHNITYSYTDLTTSCTNTCSFSIAVNALPTVGFTSAATICRYATGQADPATGGTWVSSNPGVATIDNGVITGVTAGTATFTFTSSDLPYCSATTAVFRVLEAPDAPTSGGNQTVCSDGTTTQTLTATATAPISANILWYTTANGMVTTTTPTQVGVGTTTYYAASQFTSTNCISNILARVPVVLTINALPTAPTASNVTASYNGLTHTASATAASGETIAWFTTETGNVTTTAPSRTTVGTTTAWAQATNTTTTCVGPTRTEVSVTIIKKDITGSFTADNKVYDGLTAATILTRSLSGFVSSDDVSLTGGTATFDNKNVGTGKTVTATGLSLSGADAGNYNLTGVSDASASITKFAVAVTAVTDSKIYDGTTTSSASPTVGTLVSGDVVNVAPTQVFDNKNQGTGKTLTPSGLTIKDGAAADVTGNYTITYTPDATGVINKAAVTVTANTDTKTYDGTTASSVAPTVGTLVSGDVVNVAPTQVFDNKNQGTDKTLTPSGLTIKDGAAADVTGNYTITYAPDATGVINKAAVTVTANTDTKTYDGTTASSVAPTVGTLVSGDVVNVAPTQAYDNKNVGAMHVMTASGLTIKDGSSTDVTGNYDITYNTVATGVINKAAVTVTANTDTKTYDGTTASSVAPTVGTLVSGDVVNVAPTQVFDNKNQGTGKTLTPSGLTIKDGAAADVTGNYTITYAPDATGVITKLAITGFFTAPNKVYDGNTTASVSTRTLPTAVSGDVVSLTGGTATFDDKNVGTSKTVTLTGASLSGSDAGNYNLTGVNTTTADITGAPLTITAGNQAKCEGTLIDLGTTLFTASTMVGSESVASVTLSSTGSLISAASGSHPIVPSAAVPSAGTDLGNYDITYVDGTLTVNAAPAAPTATSPEFTCGDGTTTQVATATASAPSGLSVVWYNASTGGSVVSSPTQTGVGSTTYYAESVKATTSCVSLTRTPVTVTIVSQLTLAFTSKVNNLCNAGNTGKIKVTAAGGSTVYNYTILSGPIGATSNTTGATTGEFTNLTSGTYTIGVTDAKGCTATLAASVTITEPAGTVPDITLQPAEFTSSLFAASGSENYFIFEVREIGGNPALNDLLRITKQAGYTIELPNISSYTIDATTYPLDNMNWTGSNSNPFFYNVQINNPLQVNCSSAVYLALKITRNTPSRSNFNLTAQMRNVTGEVNKGNQTIIITLVGN